jgi:hypothetical protein
MKKFDFNASTVGRFFVLFALFATGAIAYQQIGVLAEVARSGVVAAGPSYPVHARITCDTDGELIKPSGSHQLVSYECTAKGAVVVGSTNGTGTAVTSSDGVEFASGDRFGSNVAAPEMCITASGTTVIHCRFLVSQRVNP